ncbi:MAG: type IV secretion system protein [Neisseriaceae bacterium]|nr:type IV secretion system protein [Neisseriaceae bacterium]
MAFELLTQISTEAEKVISQLTSSLGVWSASAAAIGAAGFTLWLLYRAWQVLGGWAEASVPTILKDATIVYVILAIAGSVAVYQTTVHNFMKDTPARIAKDLSGETTVTALVESKLEVALKNLDKATTDNPPPDNYPATYWGDVQRRWHEMISPLTDIGDSISDFFDICIIVLKLMIIIGGLLYLAIALTKIILINKMAFMLCLGVGPLFLMFSAFKATRNWFNSWLNYTVGYGFSYAIIMFSAKILMQILDVLWKGDVSFLDAFSCLFVSVALAIVIARVGDIVSAWFSAGNIADGTAAAAAVAMGSMGGRIKGMAQTAGGNAKEAATRGYQAWKNRGQAKMNRYNTLHNYNKNRKEAAEAAKQTTSIKQGK